MGGEGFMIDMINSLKSNRTLIKGNSSAAFNSFDSKAYGTPSKKRIPKYKEATPEYLAQLQTQILADNARVARIKRKIILWTTVGAAICLCLILLFKF